MARSSILLAALVLSSGLGGTALADPAAPVCGVDVPGIVSVLDAADPALVEEVMAVVLDGDPMQILPAGTAPDEARQLFDVLFHPVFLESLTAENIVRLAAWDSLAGAIEAAYQPPAS